MTGEFRLLAQAEKGVTKGEWEAQRQKFGGPEDSGGRLF